MKQSPVTPQHIRKTTDWDGSKGSRGIAADTMAEVYIKRGVLPLHPHFYSDRMIMKGRDASKEVLASQIIGVVAPEIHVPCWLMGDRAIMRWVKGRAWASHKTWKCYSENRLSKTARFEVGLMFVIDRLIGNNDRHNGNFMLSTDGHIKAIDHGCSFSSVLRKPYSYDSPAVLSLEEREVRLGAKAAIRRVRRNLPLIVALLNTAIDSDEPRVTPELVTDWCDKMRQKIQ